MFSLMVTFVKYLAFNSETMFINLTVICIHHSIIISEHNLTRCLIQNLMKIKKKMMKMVLYLKNRKQQNDLIMSVM